MVTRDAPPRVAADDSAVSSVAMLAYAGGTRLVAKVDSVKYPYPCDALRPQVNNVDTPSTTLPARQPGRALAARINACASFAAPSRGTTTTSALKASSTAAS